MNQFKKDLNRELRSVSLSSDRKQLIAKKAKAKLHNQKKRSNWQYRFVLATFTIFSLGFGYLLWQEDDHVSKSQGAVPIESVTSTNWSMLNNDFLKGALLISITIVLRIVMKKRLQKRGKGLPVCVKCGEEWSYKEALKKSMKNGEMDCPYCDQKQYRTRKSALKGARLNFLMPFMIFVPQLFENIIPGLVAYIFCTAYLIFSLNPYYMDLQEKDVTTEPLW